MSQSEPTPLYREGRHYDELVRAVALPDAPFYVSEAGRAGGPVLELACGTGRMTISGAQAGVEMVGLNLAEGMLARAREGRGGER